ncbi:glutathione peroxidase [Bdellovibrio sp. SKB1291214]|uniref:glutathione peroxidase n=1 Tax=Bdellovibrio sp. SKB1291214 TaxID=1732569 RepID=UPI000B51D9D9|nr:glutathione peroxidase [Bdellovibrio sp. SKB1291214]UYL08077.1 glutathione peroxidase [Bdellovibrio sp. SKB1291214]
MLKISAKVLVVSSLFLGLLSSSVGFAEEKTSSEVSSSDSKPRSFYELSANDISGKKVHFSSYRGKVVLVVNTASQCGFTPQLKDLEGLYKKYSERGFVVLAFPSNDFKQEKGDNTEVQSFAKKEYGCTFPFFDKAPVTGPNKQPVYQFLTEQKPGLIFKDVSWNFEKFLVNRKGQVVDRWTSITKPSSDKIVNAIEKALAEPL